MTRTRVLAALLAGLTLAGLGAAATALGSDDPASTPVPVTVAHTRAATPGDTSRATTPAPATGAVTRIKNDDRTGDDRSDDHGGRHGSDDGPGHDRFDDNGGDR